MQISESLDYANRRCVDFSRSCASLLDAIRPQPPQLVRTDWWVRRVAIGGRDADAQIIFGALPAFTSIRLNGPFVANGEMYRCAHAAVMRAMVKVWDQIADALSLGRTKRAHVFMPTFKRNADGSLPVGLFSLLPENWLARQIKARWSALQECAESIRGFVCTEELMWEYHRAKSEVQSGSGRDKAAVYATNVERFLSWPEIMAALEREDTKEGRRQISHLNKITNGPIAIRHRAPPTALKSELLDWWVNLAVAWDKVKAKADDMEATVSDTFSYGRNGTVVPAIAGHVKSRKTKKLNKPAQS